MCLSRSIRQAVVSLVAVLILAGPALAGPAADISGTWVLTNLKSTSVPARERIPQTVEGTPPPFQPQAAALYEQRLRDSDDGHPFAPLSNSCLTNGMPLLMSGDTVFPFQVVQSPGQVTLLFELFHIYRVIRLDRGHPNELDPTYLGDSVGHWEGDTLVVDTVGISDRTTLDMTGLPHSDALHLVERIRKTTPETLEDLITVEDPKTFTRPWTMRMVYAKSEFEVSEFFCENNRNRPTSDGHSSFQGR
jgi:hypothetical protein